MLNVAIVDDEKSVSETLKQYLDEYAKEKDVEFSVDYESDPLEFIETYTERFDIIFLDIEMPHIDGLSLAHKIRERDDDVSIVFVTNMKQYVIRGYEVSADDYILKPVVKDAFYIKLDRVVKKILNKKDVVKFKINDDGIIKFIPLSSIRYIDVFQHKLSFHTTDSSYEMRGSLNKIEPFFTEHNFAKCNNYCLVNLRYVSGISDYSLFVSRGRNKDGNDTLQISHLRKKELVSLLNKYLGVNG